MKVEEIVSEGLRREYQVLLPIQELSERVNRELHNLQAKSNIKGFRPGKVPLDYLRKMYGQSIEAETIEAMLTEANQQLFQEKSLRPAQTPEIEFVSKFEGPIDLTKSTESLA